MILGMFHRGMIPLECVPNDNHNPWMCQNVPLLGKSSPVASVAFAMPTSTYCEVNPLATYGPKERTYASKTSPPSAISWCITSSNYIYVFIYITHKPYLYLDNYMFKRPFLAQIDNNKNYPPINLRKKTWNSIFSIYFPIKSLRLCSLPL